MKFFRNAVDKDKYIIATYDLKSKTSLKDVAWNLAAGQSFGNPSVRNQWETDELFEKHSCIILDTEKYLDRKTHGFVPIAFPICNTNWETDGISHLLCQLMGGQMDIDIIKRCRLIDLEMPETVTKYFLGPKYGITGMRRFTGCYDQPLLGSIIKPKIGISPETLLDMTKELVEGGVNFNKEDEIMANPACCPLKDRIKIISDYLNKQYAKVIYAFCINGDPHTVLDKAKLVSKLGGNAVHINIWSGLGIYNSLRKLDLPLFIHFQKSGDKVFTDKQHRFSIHWNVICYLAGIMGVDCIHNGMWGGYADDDPDELQGSIDVLHKYNVLPVLSCGMHPGLVNKVTERFGIDYMANVGGAIHGHPSGTRSGAIAMKHAIEGVYSKEYNEAIKKWSLQC